jgi:hypothetical protein
MMQPMVTSGAVAKPNSSSLQFAVGLHADAAAQIVQEKNLLGFRQAEFPWQAGMLDGTERRGAGAAGVAGDEDHVSVRLGYACGYCAHTYFRHQLDGDARLRVDVLEVVDKLGEILDGVDVVMGRRRDETDAGNGVASPGDDLVDLVAGQLAALAGLGALRHLDLQLVGIHEVIGGYPEAAAGYLLHRATARVATGVGREARFVFAAFAGVRHAAQPVHRDGESFVCFLADGAEAHCARSEALDDLLGRLDFFNRDGCFGVLQLQKPAQRTQVAVLVVD